SVQSVLQVFVTGTAAYFPADLDAGRMDALVVLDGFSLAVPRLRTSRYLARGLGAPCGCIGAGTDHRLDRLSARAVVVAGATKSIFDRCCTFAGCFLAGWGGLE